MKNEKTKIRAFIAIPIPENIKDNIANSQEILKQKFNNDEMKWVKVSSMHITIKFLGDIETAIIPDIKKIVQDSSDGINSFKLGVEKIGVFPNIRRARVLWSGIVGEVKTFADLYEQIDNNMVSLNFKKESKSLTPHITLARAKHKPVNPKILKQIIEENQSLGLGEFNVNTVILYKSELRPTGALYTPLWTVDLGL